MDKKLNWEKIKTQIFPFYVGSHHRAEHVLRVITNSIKIYESESFGNFDRHIVNKLIVASALHDICRPIEKDDHAAEGSILARTVLSSHFTDMFNDDDIDEICEAIRTHRYSKGLKASSQIGLILQDADRLDAIGPLGIARCFEYSVKNDIPIDGNTGDGTDTAFQHLEKKCAKLTPDTFNTVSAGHIAESYNEYITVFISLYRSQQGDNVDFLEYMDMGK